MGDISDMIEFYVADYSMLGAECGTDYCSPCCDFGAVYAHFWDEELIGFQCAECGTDYSKDFDFTS